MSNEAVKTKVDQQLKDNPVMLYMKGDRVFPQCGFSARVVEILDHIGVKYETFDILTDAELREGLKEISSWPTYPQLYVNGELVGGCDIITSLFQNGELKKMLVEKNILAS